MSRLPSCAKISGRHIHRVLVVEHGRLVGIVSTLDLVRLIADKRVVPV